MASQQTLPHRWASQGRTEELRIDPTLPERCVLDAFVAEFLHHRRRGAQVEQGLVVGRFEQFPEQGLEHAHAVVLKIFRKMGVIAGDQRNIFRLGQPDSA